MENPPYQPIEWLGDRLRWINQTLLPALLSYKESNRIEEVEAAILRLEVRGAPLIGIAALYGAVLLLKSDAPGRRCGELTSAQIARIREIGRVRPTAVNLMNAVAYLLREITSHPDADAIDIAIATAIEWHEKERTSCQKIAEAGADILPDSGAVLTHCNTGPLATGGIGTALGAILLAVKERGKHFSVFATETAPLRQGARLTTWELSQWDVPVTLLPDTAAASLLLSGKIQAVIVGADRVARNGDVANKIGTCGLAAIAHLANVPFYAAFPWTTVDAEITDGSAIPIELRSGDEVLKAAGYTEEKHPDVWNPAFDVTPAKWVTTYITDRGSFDRARFATYMNQL